MHILNIAESLFATLMYIILPTGLAIGTSVNIGSNLCVLLYQFKRGHIRILPLGAKSFLAFWWHSTNFYIIQSSGYSNQRWPLLDMVLTYVN